MTTLQKNAKELLQKVNKVISAGPGHWKHEFLPAGRKFLKSVLKELNVPGNVRLCQGGPAVTGEAILHTDCVYVDIHVGLTGERTFMFRTCKGQKDYSGGDNQWYSYEKLAADPSHFVEILKNYHKSASAC